MSEQRTPDETHQCGCDSSLGIDALRDLVAGGLGQWEASVALWGPVAAREVAV
jgi:hypothetical protein